MRKRSRRRWPDLLLVHRVRLVAERRVPAFGEKRDATVYGAETCIRVGPCTRSQAVVVAGCVRFQQRGTSEQMRGTGYRSFQDHAASVWIDKRLLSV